jgi:hypothetical protein
MNRLKQFSLLALTISLFTSCDFISNVSTYKDTTQGFVESLIEKDYEKSVTILALENVAYTDTNMDTTKWIEKETLNRILEF